MTPAPAKIDPKPNTPKNSTHNNTHHADYHNIKDWHDFREALAQKNHHQMLFRERPQPNAGGKKG